MRNFQPQTTPEQAKELARLGTYLPPTPTPPSISNMNMSSLTSEPATQVNAPTIVSSPSSTGLSSLTTESLTKLNNSNNDLLIKLRFLLKLEQPPLPEDFIKAILEINSFPNMKSLIETIREFLEKTV